MFDLQASDPVDLHLGDRLDVLAEIRHGDVISLDRIEPDLVHLRAVPPEQRATHDGPLYAIQRGERPGQIVLKRHPPA